MSFDSLEPQAQIEYTSFLGRDWSNMLIWESKVKSTLMTVLKTKTAGWSSQSQSIEHKSCIIADANVCTLEEWESWKTQGGKTSVSIIDVVRNVISNYGKKK